MTASEFAGLIYSTMQQMGILGIIQAAIAFMVTLALVRFLLSSS